jgi:hypothetical protein
MLEKQFWKRKRRANNLKRRIIGTLSTFSFAFTIFAIDAPR